MGKGNRNRAKNAIYDAADVELTQKNKAFENFMKSPITDDPLASVVNHSIDIKTNNKQKKFNIKSTRTKRDADKNQVALRKQTEDAKEERDLLGGRLINNVFYQDEKSIGDTYYNDGILYINKNNHGDISEEEYKNIMTSYNAKNISDSEINGKKYLRYELPLFHHIYNEERTNEKRTITIRDVGSIIVTPNDKVGDIPIIAREKFGDVISNYLTYTFNHVILGDPNLTIFEAGIVNNSILIGIKSKIKPAIDLEYGLNWLQKKFDKCIDFDSDLYLSSSIKKLIDNYEVHEALLFIFVDQYYIEEDEQKGLLEYAKKLELQCIKKYNACPFIILPVISKDYFSKNCGSSPLYLINIIKGHTEYKIHIPTSSDYKNIDNSLNRIQSSKFISIEQQMSSDQVNARWSRICKNKTIEESKWADNNFIGDPDSNFTFTDNIENKEAQTKRNFFEKNQEEILTVGGAALGFAAFGFYLIAMYKEWVPGKKTLTNISCKKKPYDGVNLDDKESSVQQNNNNPEQTSFIKIDEISDCKSYRIQKN